MRTEYPSEPTYEIQFERGVPIPMRDGTVLDAEIYRPKAEGRFPVIIERVCYDLSSRCKKKGEFFAARGYVFIGNSVRGAFASQGQFDLGRSDGWGENQDGYDTIEWAAAQSWSTGKVTMEGGSYSGFTQYLAAPTRPPHLRTLFVREGIVDFYRDWAFPGGAFNLSIIYWAIYIARQELNHPSAPPNSDASRRRLETAFEV